jgi:hypothetical protein
MYSALLLLLFYFTLGSRHRSPRSSVPSIPSFPVEPSFLQYFIRSLDALGIIKITFHNLAQPFHHILVLFFQFGLTYRLTLFALRLFHFFEFAVDGVAHDPRGQDTKQHERDTGGNHQVAFFLCGCGAIFVLAVGIGESVFRQGGVCFQGYLFGSTCSATGAHVP